MQHKPRHLCAVLHPAAGHCAGHNVLREQAERDALPPAKRDLRWRSSLKLRNRGRLPLICAVPVRCLDIARKKGYHATLVRKKGNFGTLAHPRSPSLSP